jgi:hypothetical protein
MNIELQRTNYDYYHNYYYYYDYYDCRLLLRLQLHRQPVTQATGYTGNQLHRQPVIHAA